MATTFQLDPNLVLAALLVLIISSFVSIVRRSFRTGASNDDGGGGAVLPSPAALPIIGNLHQLAGGHHHRKLQALAQRHGPLFLLRLGSVPTVVVSSAPMAEAVLKTQDHVFCGRPQQYTARGILYNCRDIGFSPYGERWRQLRRIAVVHLLSVKRVDSFRVIREEEAASLVERIRRAATAQREEGGGGKRRHGISVSELVVSLTYAVISRAAFGNKLGGMDPGKLRAMMREVGQLLQTIAVSDVFPQLWWVDWATGLHARTKRMAAKLDHVFEGALREHEKSSRNYDDGEDGDLLDDLLSIVKEGGGAGFNLERDDIKGLIFDLFVGGTDTTAKWIEWTMAELIKNPKEMEKVQAEVRQVAGAQGVVREDQLGTMRRLQAAMKEAMRLHPTVPLLVPREAIQDTRLHGYDIHAKTRVVINAWAIGRDGEAWEDAEEFQPERFMDTEIDYSGKDFRFIPFSAGRRGCPGTAFATRLAELALATMLYHFDWQLPDGQDLESFEVVESGGLSAGLKSALTLVANPWKA